MQPQSDFCDLCGIYLTGVESRTTERCGTCRRVYPVHLSPERMVETARAILNACGECASCEQGHPERCDRAS